MNTSLCDTHFALPMVGYTVRAVEKGTSMADQYIGDMLQNFMLNEEAMPFCGVYAMNVRKQEEWEKDISGVWERQERKIMGLIYSPYNACRAVMWDRRVSFEDMQSIKNTFGW